jgi:predicted amidohydrolase
MNTAGQLNILACQVDVPMTRTLADRDAHLADMSAKVKAMLGPAHADLVVLPELSSIEYSRPAFERLAEIAEPLHGPSFDTWRRVSREFQAYVAFSFPRRDEEGYFITLAVTDPAGNLVGHYDKIYLAQFGASMEKEFFRRGNELFVFDVNGFRLGAIICADIRIPELSRALTVEGGADFILHSGAYFRDTAFYSWHHFVIARAIENQVFFLSLNRAGQDYGKSMFCPPWVDETCQPFVFEEHGEQFARLTAERSEIAVARERYSFLRDRLAHHALPAKSEFQPVLGKAQ